VAGGDRPAVDQQRDRGLDVLGGVRAASSALVDELLARGTGPLGGQLRLRAGFSHLGEPVGTLGAAARRTVEAVGVLAATAAA